jgi:hypothetical protein
MMNRKGKTRLVVSYNFKTQSSNSHFLFFFSRQGACCDSSIPGFGARADQ